MLHSLAQVVAAQIGGDLVEPRRKALEVAQPVQLAIGADKALLAEVSRFFGIAAVAERKAVKAALPAPDQDIERLVLASPEAQDEIGVAHTPLRRETSTKSFTRGEFCGKSSGKFRVTYAIYKVIRRWTQMDAE